MKIPLEKHFPYAGLSLLVLVIFYGTYFGKMLAQKRKGIQTKQIGRRKEAGIPKYKNQFFRYLGRKSLIRRK